MNRKLKKLAWSVAILSLGIVAGLSGRVDASFSLTTAVTGVSDNNGSLTSGSLAANTSYTENGIQFTTTSQGGSYYTDSQGTTVYFVEDSRTATIKSVSNEQVYLVNSTAGAVDISTIIFSTLITITNNGATGTFNEGPSTLVLNLTGGDENYTIFTSNLTPASQTIGGTLFSASLPQATSGDINSQANGAVSASISAASSVPEPASMALLGVGAIGIVGAMVRQARKA